MKKDSDVKCILFAAESIVNTILYEKCFKHTHAAITHKSVWVHMDPTGPHRTHRTRADPGGLLGPVHHAKNSSCDRLKI